MRNWEENHAGRKQNFPLVSLPIKKSIFTSLWKDICYDLGGPEVYDDGVRGSIPGRSNLGNELL